MLRRQWLVFALTVFSLLLPAMRSSAYEADTHYYLTYVICRSVGFTHAESMLVAAADQGMDDSDGTSPVGITDFYVANQWQWHALDRGGGMGARGIVNQKNRLFEAAEDRWLSTGLSSGLARDPLEAQKRQLVLLGVFFHYQQDTWSHRHHRDGKEHTLLDFTTFNTPFGHVFKEGDTIHEPDYPPYDPVAALSALEEGVVYARSFLKNVLHRKPRPFLADYKPMGGKEDGKRQRSANFRHLLIEGEAGSAKKYLRELIDAQISVYPIRNTLRGQAEGWPDSISEEPHFGGAVLPAFEKVCSKPEFQSKLGGDIFLRGQNLSNPMPIWAGRIAKWNTLFPSPDGRRMTPKDLTSDYIEGLMGGWRDLLGFHAAASTGLQGITSGWREAGDSKNMISIAMLGQTILGVGKDYELWTKAGLNAPWTWVRDNGGIIAVAALRNGTILGVGFDHTLRKKANLGAGWELVPNSGGVVAVTELPDGTIVGVGQDGSLKKKARLEAPWEQVPNSGSVIAVTAMSDGTIVALTKKIGPSPNTTYLVARRTLDVPWQRVPNGFALTGPYVGRPGELSYDNNLRTLIGVTVMPDGTLLGLDSTEPKLYIKGSGRGLAFDGPIRDYYADTTPWP